MKAAGNKPFDFQKESWQKYEDGFSGIINAPTGFGKTFSVFLSVIIDAVNKDRYNVKGVQLLWVTPLRSLAKDLNRAMQTALNELEIPWQVAVRNGDTPIAERARQLKKVPQILIITPETIHLLLAQKDHHLLFENLQCVAVDEWHELLGSKRGVMTELALSRLKGLQPNLRVWGISATIGNIDEALEVLIPGNQNKTLVLTKERKKTNIISIIPEEIDTLPWAGHMGLNLAELVVPIIEKSNTTLIFTNTRGQSEAWYQRILQVYPDIAGAIALHHGSIDLELRSWIEDALHANVLKVVICTSSLDLGVDFKPVDTVIQVGSPKGVARFLQRAGRSGHSPNEVSNIYFLPTHSLELVEAAALKRAEQLNLIEDRTPMVMTFDVLIQYLVTLAVGNGFRAEEVFKEIKNTHAFSEINEEEWIWILQFITVGGGSLGAYEEFKKVEIIDGLYKVTSRRTAMNHRMNIGAIVSAPMLKVKFLSGGYIGMVEEYFVSKLNAGDSFVLGGHILDFVALKDMTVQVRKSKAKKAIAPSWLGGRLPLSSNLTKVLRDKFTEAYYGNSVDPELIALQPLFEKQAFMSHVPKANELLVEKITNKEGIHFFFYPFEGRLVHEVMGSLIAYRLSKLSPISFSIAMNDYGFELLTDVDLQLDEPTLRKVLTPENLISDIQNSINATEMARRKFRDIATISGLILQNNRGKFQTNKNLQSSAGIFFNVFEQFEANSLLLRQSYDEVFYQQLEEPRLAAALQRIEQSDIILTEIRGAFTPLSFPIKVDSKRNAISSESIEERIKKMKADMVKW